MTFIAAAVLVCSASLFLPAVADVPRGLCCFASVLDCEAFRPIHTFISPSIIPFFSVTWCLGKVSQLLHHLLPPSWLGAFVPSAVSRVTERRQPTERTMSEISPERLMRLIPLNLSRSAFSCRERVHGSCFRPTENNVFTWEMLEAALWFAIYPVLLSQSHFQEHRWNQIHMEKFFL